MAIEAKIKREKAYNGTYKLCLEREGCTSEIATRIKRKMNKTNSEEERKKISPGVFTRLKEKGLSDGQITLVNITRPGLTLRELNDTWNWISKWKRFKNKEATFYTALVENWTKTQKRT